MAERANFARVCVQLNTGKPLPKSIQIGDRRQIIQYEGIHTLCFECGIIGHRREACPTFHSDQEHVLHAGHGGSQAQKEDGQTSGHSRERNSGEETEDRYGPWTLVSHRKPRTPARKSSERKLRSGQGSH